MSKGPNRTASYLVKMTPSEKVELEVLAADANVSLADAFRDGARLYLGERVEEADRDPLANELRALARRVDSRLRR